VKKIQKQIRFQISVKQNRYDLIYNQIIKS